MNKRKWLKILLVMLAVVVMGVVFSCQSETAESGEEVLFDNTGDETITATTQGEITDLKDNETAEESSSTGVSLCVHVCGCVKSPGLYYLEEGSRLNDAVECAGGFTEEAAIDHINLARLIEDGEKIYVPSLEETENEAVDYSDKQASGDDGLININAADASSLMTLPGIGETKAKAIIEYRDKKGKFNSIEEILNVSGIGESLFEQIKEHIKV